MLNVILVYCMSICDQSFFIPGHPFMGYGEEFRVTDDCDPFVPVFYQVLGSIISTFEIINNYPVSIDLFRDPVKKNNGQSFSMKSFQMAEIIGLRRKRDQQSINRT